MSPEKQEENPDQNKFEKVFEQEISWDKLDRNSFNEIISWAKFDDKLSKEDNFKNAFNQKIDWLIDENLKNLPEEDKQKLRDLQKKSNEWKKIDWLIDSYKEIVTELSTKTAESYKRWQDITKQEEEQSKTNKESQSFIDELKKSIDKNWQLEKEKQEQQKKEAEKRNIEEKIDKVSEWNPEDGLKEWPE